MDFLNILLNEVEGVLDEEKQYNCIREFYFSGYTWYIRARLCLSFEWDFPRIIPDI